MNHTAYRHLSTLCLVMREGAEAVVVWPVRNGLISAR